MFLFAQNYFADTKDDHVDFSYLQANTFKQVLSSSHTRQKALLSVLYYQKSFYQQEPERILQESDCSSLWPTCRNIRKSLYASLAMYIFKSCDYFNISILFYFYYSVDELETKLKLKDQEISDEDVTIVESKVNLLNNEITTMQDSSRNIIKSIKSKLNNQFLNH